MKRVARALEIDVEPERMGELVEAASFRNMQTKADRFAPGTDRDAWHDTRRFFHKGESGQWRNGLSEEALALFDARLDELVGANLAHWLEHGTT